MSAAQQGGARQKSVVVTGGNRGIGLDITKAFVDAGYFVVVGARQELGLGQRFGDSVQFIHTDVRVEAGHSALAAAAVARTGTLDCYVNNAGFSEWRPIADVDDEFLDTLLGTNLKGAFWGCKAAAAAMGDGGAIVNVSSLAGKRGSANNTAYCSSMFGMNGLTQALAKEIGPRGIRVNAVCPVLVSTEGLLAALDAPGSPANGDTAGFLSGFAASQSALKRLPRGDEVAAMCVFLASDAASAITAQCINVDCGVLPQ
jgi:NAD(P)-dependent dehydrogenase (short-subunit alcohol dehydrogenase family)